MKRRLKVFLSMLMCMSLLVLYVVPVNAAVDGCVHIHIDKQPYYEYTVLNAGEHQVVHYTKYICLDCGTTTKVYSQTMGVESHSLTYDDLGHDGEFHDYMLRCTKCSYTHLQTIRCFGSSHITPW